MLDISKTFRQSISSPTAFLDIVVGLVISIIGVIGISNLEVFVWWSYFGEGESSDGRYHPIATTTFALCPIIIVIIIYSILILNNTKHHKFSKVKSYLILTILMIIFYLMRNVLFPDMFFS